MATGTNPEPQRFLVEHYRPGLGPSELRTWALRIRAAAVELAEEGVPVRYAGATILPADEALLCQFDAASEEAVRAAYERAGLVFERISPAISGPARNRRRSRPAHQEDLE
jgi:hypothetical protein